MGYHKFRYADLKKLCEDVFQKQGYSLEDSRTVTDVLLTADLFGIESHGIQRLILYASGIQAGRIVPGARMEIVKETPLSVLADGNKAMGQLSARRCMEIAIEKAKKQGIGMAVVRNSNHYGIAGYYSLMAEKEGLIGISTTNTPSVVLPTNGKQSMLGTNPVSIAMPAKPVPFFMDMATSVVTRGKLEVYAKNGDPLPTGWAAGEDGKSIHDAAKTVELTNAGKGGIFPVGGETELLGGHKGYGLGLAVELFTGILSGGFTSDKIRPKAKTYGVSHTFMAIDYGMFGDKAQTEERLSVYLQKLRDSEKAGGCTRIYTHGEKEIEAKADRLENGIPVNDGTIAEINGICSRLGLDMHSYLG